MYLHVQRYAGNMQDTRLVESCGIASFQSNETSHKFKYMYRVPVQELTYVTHRLAVDLATGVSAKPVSAFASPT